MTEKVGKNHPPKSKQFKKGVTGNPNGRPPKIQTILKKQGLSQSQVKDITTEMLAMTKEELKEIVNNPKSKSFEILLASAIVKGISKGDLSQIFGYALTRVFGQPKQDIDVNASVLTWNETKTYETIPPVETGKKPKKKQTVRKKPEK